MSADPPGDPGRDEPDWPGTMVAPDDLSELRADEIALRRERASARRRERWYRLTGGSRLRAYGVSVPLLLAAVLAVAGFGALLILLGPRGTRGPAPAVAPAGAAPTAPAGRPGGRLPAVSLTLSDGAPQLASALGGPAAVLLLPAGCDCLQTVDVTADRAIRDGLQVSVIQPTVDATRGLGDGGVRELSVYADPAGQLLATYGSTGSAPTLLVLDAAGAVRTVRTGVTAADAAAAFPPGASN